MWLKVVLLLIYLTVLFLLARCLEVLTWYEQGQLSRRLLDPMALSVIKLKQLLEQRGVNYENMVEKSELTEIVEATGAVTEDETEVTSSLPSDDSLTITNFTCGSDFYEQVEDAKDSMWLVEVHADQNGPKLLSEQSWKSIRKKVGKFGVRFGRFDCELDTRLCTRKAWFSSRLVLALPETHKSKANVVLYTIPGPIKVSSLFDWIKSRADQNIKSIAGYKTFKSEWLEPLSHLSPEVRVVFLSTMSTVPLFLSALSVKFPGRVKFGSVNTNLKSGKDIAKRLGIKSRTSYLVITPERTFLYGQNRGERYTFSAMELFLKCLHPSLNDLFIVSIILTNIMTAFELCVSKTKFCSRIVKFLWCVFKYNMVLILVWITLLGIFQLPSMETAGLLGLKFIRLMSGFSVSSMFRRDIFFYSDHWKLAGFILTSIIGSIALVRYWKSPHDEQEDEESDWWNFSSVQNVEYGEYWWNLTRRSPFDAIFNPSIGMFQVGDHDTADIDRPFVSHGYMAYLPTWKYMPQDTMKDTEGKRKYKKADKHTLKPEIADTDLEANGGSDIDFCDRHLCLHEMVDTIMDSNYSCECTPNCACLNGKSARHNPTTNADGLLSEADVTCSTGMKKADNNQSSTNHLTETINSTENRKPDGFIDFNQCVICLENYLPSEKLRGLPCSHAFHDKCILAWLKRDNHFCPVCRWPSYKPKTNDVLHTQ